LRRGGKSSRDLHKLVETAYRVSAKRGDKVLESDGVGIALMLDSMSEKPATQEAERRALIVSNYTRTNEQKIALAKHILDGDLVFEDGSKLPEKCVCDLFVIVFDHKTLRIMWRGGVAADDDAAFQPDHDALEVLNAIRKASTLLYEGATKHGSNATIEDDGNCKVFKTGFININHAYTALQLYAKNKRTLHGRPFKLKTVALAGDLGGRGVNFKPHGCGFDPARGTYLVTPHEGYLTDMFFMFDATKNRQITTHGEYVLQAIGRLCTLVNDHELLKMRVTPPRLWTSLSCYNIIRTFSRGVSQWVQVMQAKRPEETITQALTRCIEAKPEEYCELYMIYVVPTTDPRWAKKELWIRQSRLMRADRNVGKALRGSTTRVHLGTRNHGIQHDPERDRQKRIHASIEKAEELQAAGADESSEDERQDVAPPTKRRERRMNAKLFEALYQKYEELAFTAKTDAEGNKIHMPLYNQNIMLKWSTHPRFPYYPATVIGLRVEDDGADNVRAFYTIRYNVDDQYNPLENGAEDELELEPDMNEWHYPE